MPGRDEVPQGDGEEPGLIDLIAEMEGNLPLWAETVQAFPEPMNDVGSIATKWTEQLKSSGSEGKGFAHRVILFREMASELDVPASEILQLGEDYASQLVGLDRGMRALIALASSSDEEDGLEVARTLFENVLRMVGASRSQVGSLEGLSKSMAAPARQSRDLRPVLKKIETGLRGISDSQAILDEWERLILDSGLISPDTK